MAWTSVTSENFTRADHSAAQYADLDGKTLKPGTAGTWTKRNGTLRFATSDGYAGTISAPRYEIASLTIGNDQKVEFTMGNNLSSVGCWLRHSNNGSGENNASGYTCSVNFSTGDWEIKRFDAGVFHSPTIGLNLEGPTVVTGDIVSFEIEGSVIVGRHNGTVVVTASADTQYTSGGIAIGSGSSTDELIDKVEIFEAGASGPTKSVGEHVSYGAF